MSIPMMAWEGTIHISSSTSVPISSSTEGLTELVNCAALKMGIAYSELEHTLKKHGGHKAYLKGRVDYSLAFDLSKEYTTGSDGSREYEEDVKIILDALRSRTPIRVVATDGNGEGFAGDFLVSGQEFSLDGDEAQKISCTLKPYAGSGAVEYVKN